MKLTRFAGLISHNARCIGGLMRPSKVGESHTKGLISLGEAVKTRANLGCARGSMAAGLVMELLCECCAEISSPSRCNDWSAWWW